MISGLLPIYYTEDDSKFNARAAFTISSFRIIKKLKKKKNSSIFTTKSVAILHFVPVFSSYQIDYVEEEINRNLRL